VNATADEAEADRVREWIRKAAAWYALHPSTAADAIAADQRDEIRSVLKAWRSFGATPTVDQLSQCVILPPDVVRRRLDEMGVRYPRPEDEAA